jgi:hypothetical protein
MRIPPLVGRLPMLTAASAAAFAAAGPALAIEFTKHDIYYELNATDGDLGLHAILDGEAWHNARIQGPGGTFYVVRAESNDDSTEFGLTELFFESNEPPLEDRSFAELKTLFPPGLYEFRGETAETGETLASSDALTDKIPCPPRVRAPRQTGGDILLRWSLNAGVYNPDTGQCKLAGAATLVQVQVFLDLENEETGATRKFAVEIPPGITSVEVPDEFMIGVDKDATASKTEVLVIEASGNRTASEIEFELQ